MASKSRKKVYWWVGGIGGVLSLLFFYPLLLLVGATFWEASKSAFLATALFVGSLLIITRMLFQVFDILKNPKKWWAEVNAKNPVEEENASGRMISLIASYAPAPGGERAEVKDPHFLRIENTIGTLSALVVLGVAFALFEGWGGLRGLLWTAFSDLGLFGDLAIFSPDRAIAMMFSWTVIAALTPVFFVMTSWAYKKEVIDNEEVSMRPVAARSVLFFLATFSLIAAFAGGFHYVLMNAPFEDHGLDLFMLFFISGFGAMSLAYVGGHFLFQCWVAVFKIRDALRAQPQPEP